MRTINNIHLGIKNESKFKKAYLALFKYVVINRWQGACHASSAILFVVCKLLGIDAKLCVGEAGLYGGAFDHSWVEINNKVFDIAIAMPLNSDFTRGPVFDGFDLTNQIESDVLYGVYFSGLSDETKTIVSNNLYTYFKSSPNNFLYNVLEHICKEANISINIDSLKEKLKKWTWEIVTINDI